MKLSSILTGIGIGGVAVTGVLSFKAGQKAKEDGFEFSLKDITDGQKVKQFVKYFWKPVASGTATMITIGCAQGSNLKNLAITTAASASAVQILDRYKEKAMQYIPEDKIPDFLKDISEPSKREGPKKKMVLRSHKRKEKEPLPWNSTNLIKSDVLIKDFEEIEENIIISIPYCDIDIITTPAAYVNGVMDVNKYFAFESFATISQFLETQGVSYDARVHPDWHVTGWEWDDPEYWLNFRLREVGKLDGMRVYVLEFPATPKIIDCLIK